MGEMSRQGVFVEDFKAGVDPQQRVYREPNFQNTPKKEMSPFFQYIGYASFLLLLVALMALDYKSIIFIGKISIDFENKIDRFILISF